MLGILRNIIWLAFLLPPLFLNAQYLYEWNDYYGGNGMDEVASLTKTSEGEVFITGLVKDSIDAMWLVKIDSKGKKLWSKIYSEYSLMQPKKIIETSDKNLVITGIVAEGDSVPHKIWIIKINKAGDILWEKLYSGKGDAYSTDLIETFDKGLVISGYTSKNVHLHPDWYVLKVDSLGNKMWDKSFGSPYDDRALALTQLFDSTIMVVGYISYSYGGFKKASYTKFTNSGIDLWADDLNLGQWSVANSVTSTSDSAFIISAEIKMKDLIDFNMVILKMDISGDTIWTKRIKKRLWEHPVSIIETYDRGFAIAYTSKTDGVGNTNVALMKLSPLGEMLWDSVFHRNSDDYAAEVIEGPNNGLIMGVSTFTLQKAWNYGVLKFKSIEMSDLKFLRPHKPVATVYNKNLNVNAIITGYKKPINVKVYVNRKLVKTFTSFKRKPDKTNEYILENQLNLENGLNIIDYVVTDYKEFKFVKSRKIYYLPNATPHW